MTVTIATTIPLENNNSDNDVSPCQPVIEIHRWQNQAQVEQNTNFRFQLAGTGSATFNGESLTLKLDTTSEEGYMTARIHEIDLSLSGQEREQQKCWDPTKGVKVNYRIKWSKALFSPTLTENAYLVNAPESISDPWTVVGIARSPLTQSYSIIVAQKVVPTPDGLDGYFSVTPLTQIDPTEWHEVTLRVVDNQADVIVKQGDTVVKIRREAPNSFEKLGMAFSIDNEGLPGQIAPPSDSQLQIDYFSARLL